MIKKNTLLCASNNQGKIKEFKELFPMYDVLGLKHLAITEDIPETGNTFEDNALIKLRYLAKIHPHISIIADDSGLMVDALNGAPGVYSARYSGEGANAEKNNAKLLTDLAGETARSARFVCCLALYHKGLEYVFEAACEGEIAEEISGSNGFGYDPLFIPEGYDKSFADLDPAVKKKVSHRAKAVAQLKDFLLR